MLVGLIDGREPTAVWIVAVSGNRAITKHVLGADVHYGIRDDNLVLIERLEASDADRLDLNIRQKISIGLASAVIALTLNEVEAVDLGLYNVLLVHFIPY